MELTLEAIQSLIKMVVDNKLDKLELGDLKISKSRYEASKAEARPTVNNPTLIDEDEILYWSTSTPTLTAEQIELLAANPPPKPKRGRPKNTPKES